MDDKFKPFSMMDIWKTWSNSGVAFENATKNFAEAKGKMSALVESKEGKRIQELASQISSLNMELASAMSDYTTKAISGKLTPTE